MIDSLVQLMDLPDEILVTIFKKLDNVQVLYSLLGVDKRLDRIVHDLVFTSHLTLSRQLSNGLICSLDDLVLNRFCLQILAEIHDKIQWLDLESLSMESILLAANYPNLRRLGLYNIEEKTAIRIFNDETSVVQHVLKNQISSLVITFSKHKDLLLMGNVVKNIFIRIFTTCTNLRYLNFDPHLNYSERLLLLLDSQSPKFFCSTLQELHVNLHNFDTCLYLLDGRFNKLEIFYVNIITCTTLPNPMLKNEKQLVNMKCFSLNIQSTIHYYDESIVSLLKRMSNLEKLALYIKVNHKKTFIDGNILKKSISHMTKLKQFIFNIESFICIRNQTDLPSNEDIQQSFLSFTDNQVISCTDYFLNQKIGQCHIYSYPYTLKHYYNITNNFPGGLFKYVCEIILYDERSFEHEFFMRIAQSFPFLKILTLSNNQPQYEKSNVDNENLPIIEYSHLSLLYLPDIHDDYLVQFLDHKKTYFPSTFRLVVRYESLKRVTHNFTIDRMRVNCGKVRELCIDTDEKYEPLKNYFCNARLY